MKEISSRFTATTTDYANHSEELRRLPRPIYRYEQPVGDLLDGAVFALSIEGTAPTALVLIELHRNGEGDVLLAIRSRRQHLASCLCQTLRERSVVETSCGPARQLRYVVVVLGTVEFVSVSGEPHAGFG